MSGESQFVTFCESQEPFIHNSPPTPELKLDLNDWISEEEQRTLRYTLRSKEAQLKINVILPTHNSHTWIRRSLVHLNEQFEAAREVMPDWRVELVVVVNGPNQKATLQELLTLQSDKTNDWWILTVLQLSDPSSKIRAMNAAAHYSKEKGVDVLGFIDDDVVFSPSAFLKTVKYLIEHDDVFIAGAVNWPIEKPLIDKGMFARFEYKWEARPKTTPKGKNQYILADTYPFIPEFIINDDNYLLSYFSMPDDSHAEVFQRIKVVPGLQVFFKLVGNAQKFFKRMERIYMGREQTVEVFGHVKTEAIRRRTGRKYPFSPKTLMRDLSFGQKVKMVFVICRAILSLFWVHQKVKWKIILRKALGRYPYASAWNASITTKPIDAQLIDVPR